MTKCPHFRYIADINAGDADPHPPTEKVKPKCPHCNGRLVPSIRPKWSFCQECHATMPTAIAVRSARQNAKGDAL